MKRTKLALKTETVRVLSNTNLTNVGGGGAVLVSSACPRGGAGNATSGSVTSDVNGSIANIGNVLGGYIIGG